jgi:hypothetical protein
MNDPHAIRVKAFAAMARVAGILINDRASPISMWPGAKIADPTISHGLFDQRGDPSTNFACRDRADL